MNGILGGLVAITASCNGVSTVSSLIIGTVAEILVIITVIVFENVFKLDDVVGAFSVHGTNGIWGTLAVAIFSSDPEKRTWRL